MMGIARSFVGVTALLVACTPNPPTGEAVRDSVGEHIAHVLAARSDTPDGRGYLPVAMAEATIARLHAGLAQQNRGDLESMQLHTLHVIHAIDPNRIEVGPGLGFGLDRAVSGIAEEIRIAIDLQSDPQFTMIAGDVLVSAGAVLVRAQEAIRTAESVSRTLDPERAAALVAELKGITDRIVGGVEADGDETKDRVAGEGGLRRIDRDMETIATLAAMPPAAYPPAGE